MESLPVEVIGNILSHLGAARDVVVASTTCRKWRVAARHHLNTLCFNTADWPVYRELSTEDLEILITQTIMQTSCLQHLSIRLGNHNEFSAAPVIAWLMYTRESLRFLTYMMKTKPCVNVLERCGKSKLERLVLGYTCIPTVDPAVQRFPSLLALTLSRVTVSSTDLNALLSACPKLVTLSLIQTCLFDTDVSMSGSETTLELTSSSLRAFYTEELTLDTVILEADHLDNLHLKGSVIERFELRSSNSLRALKIEDTTIGEMDFGEATELLEVLDVSDFEMLWPNFYQIISRASKLRQLRLWRLKFEGSEEDVDIETIAASFPRLNRLALGYELADGTVIQALQGSTLLQKVVFLELGSSIINDTFAEWIGGVLERCPSLRKLVIHGILAETKAEDFHLIGKFTTSIVNLMRKFSNVDIEFNYT
ncbi:hypothetical protein M758_5G119800 [Ceratodon purpureus]|nr:hypothetical protein M758_5G119800 [Ceratodon purpureus]